MGRNLAFLILAALVGCAPKPQATPQVVQPDPAETAAIQQTQNATNPPKPEQPPQAEIDLAEVKWDESSRIAADFDGDGKSDKAALGFVGNGFVIAIDRATGQDSYEQQLLPFGINGRYEAATCGPDIKLEVMPLSCGYQTEDVKLPGCVESQGASELRAGNGECDKINLYWSHDDHQMVWWRN